MINLGHNTPLRSGAQLRLGRRIEDLIAGCCLDLSRFIRSGDTLTSCSMGVIPVRSPVTLLVAARELTSALPSRDAALMVLTPR